MVSNPGRKNGISTKMACKKLKEYILNDMSRRADCGLQ